MILLAAGRSDPSLGYNTAHNCREPVLLDSSPSFSVLHLTPGDDTEEKLQLLTFTPERSRATTLAPGHLGSGGGLKGGNQCHTGKILGLQNPPVVPGGNEKEIAFKTLAQNSVKKLSHFVTSS